MERSDQHICQTVIIEEDKAKKVVFIPHPNLKQCKDSSKKTEEQYIVINQEENAKKNERRTPKDEPYIGEIIVALPDQNGPYSTGTGCLLSIGNQIVILTCAHIFCQVQHGASQTIKYAKGGYFLLGKQKIKISMYFIYPKYEDQNELYDGYDLAIATFDQNLLPDKGVALKWSNDFKSEGVVDIIGYPGEYKHLQYGMSGKGFIETTKTTQNELITYENEVIYTTPGQSGCPVLDCGNKGKVVGVHVGFDESLKKNVATKLSKEFLFWVLTILNVDPEEAKKCYQITVQPQQIMDQTQINQSQLAKLAGYTLSSAKKYPVNLLEFSPFNKELLKKAASSVGQVVWTSIETIISTTLADQTTLPFVYANVAAALIYYSVKEASNSIIQNLNKNLIKAKNKLQALLQNYNPVKPKTKELTDLKNEVFQEIITSKTMSLEYLAVAGHLYYTIDRMIIQDYFLESTREIFANKKTRKEVEIHIAENLKRYAEGHGVLKNKLIDLVNQSLSINNNVIKIKKPDGYYIELFDFSKSISQRSFATSIVNEFYRCHITDQLVDNLYKEFSWNNFWDNCYKKDFKTLAAALISEKKIGFLVSPTKEISYKYIWKFGLKGNEGMAYFMDSDGSGYHTANYDDGETINFHSVRYLYYAIRGGYPSLVTLDNNLKENYYPLTTDSKTLSSKYKEFNWAIELNSHELISSISYNNFNYLKLKCVNFADNFKEFTGYIRNPDESNMNICFGAYSMFNLVKYYTFQNSNPANDPSSHLIFNCVKQLGSANKQIGSFDTFTCKISTHYNPGMYMVRDDRDKSFSYMGNNQSGGELVIVKLKERLSPNVFKATLSVDPKFQLYISGKGNLKWTNRPRNNDRKTEFVVCIEQEEYYGPIA